MPSSETASESISDPCIADPRIATGHSGFSNAGLSKQSRAYRAYSEAGLAASSDSLFYDVPPATVSSFSPMHGNVVAANQGARSLYEMWFRVGDLRAHAIKIRRGVAAIALQTFINGFGVSADRLFPQGIGADSLFDQLHMQPDERYFRLGILQRMVTVDESDTVVGFATSVDQAAQALQDQRNGPASGQGRRAATAGDDASTAYRPQRDGTVETDAAILEWELRDVDRKPDFQIIWKIVLDAPEHVRGVLGSCEVGDAVAGQFEWRIVNKLYLACQAHHAKLGPGEQWVHFQQALDRAGLIDTPIVTYNSGDDSDLVISSNGTPFVDANIKFVIGVLADSELSDKLMSVPDDDPLYVSWRVDRAAIPAGQQRIDVTTSFPRQKSYTTGLEVKDDAYELLLPEATADPLHYQHEFQEPGQYRLTAIIVGTKQHSLGGIYAVDLYIDVQSAEELLDSAWDDYNQLAFCNHLASLEQAAVLGLRGTSSQSTEFENDLCIESEPCSAHRIVAMDRSFINPDAGRDYAVAANPNGPRDQNVPTWQPSDFGGGRFLAQDLHGTSAKGQWFAWSDSPAYRYMSHAGARGTAQGFGISGLKPETELVDLAFPGPAQGRDVGELITLYPGNYVVIFSPQDGGPPALLYTKVSTRDHEKAYQAMQKRHDELWNISEFGLVGRQPQEGTSELQAGRRRHLRDDSEENFDELRMFDSCESQFLPIKCVLASQTEGLRQLPLFMVQVPSHVSNIPTPSGVRSQAGYCLIDASVGVGQTVYRGGDGSPEAAIDAFQRQNKHPAGKLQLEWSPSKWGLRGANIKRTLTTRGSSWNDQFAMFAGINAGAAGIIGLVVSIVNPTGPAGLLILSAASALGAASTAAAISDNLHQDEPDEWRLVMDYLGLATALLGTVTTVAATLGRASATQRVAGRAGEFVALRSRQLVSASALFSVAKIEMALTAVETIFIGVDYSFQIGEILSDKRLNHDQKISMVTTLVAQAAVTGALFFVASRTQGPRADDVPSTDNRQGGDDTSRPPLRRVPNSDPLEPELDMEDLARRHVRVSERYDTHLASLVDDVVTSGPSVALIRDMRVGFMAATEGLDSADLKRVADRFVENLTTNGNGEQFDFAFLAVRQAANTEGNSEAVFALDRALRTGTEFHLPPRMEIALQEFDPVLARETQDAMRRPHMSGLSADDFRNDGGHVRGLGGQSEQTPPGSMLENFVAYSGWFLAHSGELQMRRFQEQALGMVGQGLRSGVYMSRNADDFDRWLPLLVDPDTATHFTR